MDKTVLLSRIDGLRNSLDIVIENLSREAWQQKDGVAGRAELLGGSPMWNGLGELNQQLERQRDDLTALRNDIAGKPDDDTLRTVWEQYAQKNRVSQGLLRECLEIIGMLAIRNKDLDRRILYIADQLIRESLTLSKTDDSYYLLVHGFADTVSKARARIIRLRFPEWTLWDLPLTAHELGQVVLAQQFDVEGIEEEQDLRSLTKFRDKLRQRLLQEDADLRGAKDADVWAASRVRVLIADAFAAFTMGPAYACSAIMLRLNPSVTAERDRPSDAERAEVILSMLGWMNQLVDVEEPYTRVIGILRKAWDDALSLAGAAPLDDPARSRLKDLATEFGKSVSRAFLRSPAMYRDDGWRRAKEWFDTWRKQLEKPAELTVPESDGKLRDVLNATWLCRLVGAPEDYHAIAAAGRDLCTRIIEARKVQAVGGPPTTAGSISGR